MAEKKELRIQFPTDVFERIVKQAANLGQKPGSFAKHVIMEKVTALEMATSTRSSLRILEMLQDMEEKKE